MQIKYVCLFVWRSTAESSESATNESVYLAGHETIDKMIDVVHASVSQVDKEKVSDLYSAELSSSESDIGQTTCYRHRHN